MSDSPGLKAGACLFCTKKEQNMKRTGCKDIKWSDRLIIERMLKNRESKTKIAAYIGVSRASIYNEIHRGMTLQMTPEYEFVKVYCADTAERWYQAHLAVRGIGLKLGNDFAAANYIERMIVEKRCSPAVVAAKMQEERGFSTRLCVNTIYNYIYREDVFLKLKKEHLRYKGRRRNRRPSHPKAARASAGDSIEKRPPEVKERKTFGHWEMDTVVSGKDGRGTLLVLTERTTRYEIIVLLPDRTASSVVKALDVLEKKYGRRKFRRTFKTITCDNGSEFADCQGMEHTHYGRGPRTKIYYCHPYSAYERGSNENANGLIRRFFPKGTDFSKVTKKAVRQVQDWMNQYPRKILGWKSAEDMMSIFMSSA